LPRSYDTELYFGSKVFDKITMFRPTLNVRKIDFDSALTWVSISTTFLSGLYVLTDIGVLFFSYGIMLITYLMIIARKFRVGLMAELLIFLLFLAIATLITALATGRAYGLEVERFAEISYKIALFVFFIVYYNSIFMLCGHSISVFFEKYLQVATFFACIGIAQQIVFVVTRIDFLGPVVGGAKNYGVFLGISALSVEPAFFACAMLPAAAYHMSRFVRSFRVTPGAVVTIVAILMSTSSLGFIGLVVSACATVFTRLNLKRVWVLVLTMPLVLALTFAFSRFEFFQMRWNDTISVLQGGELTMKHGMNLSTYANAVNLSIAFRSIQDNSGAGVGFGMYSSAYDNYISDYETPGYRDDIPGRGSATSLFGRVTAELGIAGWILLATCTYWSLYSVWRGVHLPIAIAYSSTFVIILLRMGEYYVNGVALVFLMIYLVYRESKSSFRLTLAPSGK